MADQRKSFAHLASKFNTKPPPGYVAGRGRGVSGFSQPPVDEEKKGRGRGHGAAISGSCSDAPTVQGPSGPPGKVEGETADTSNLNLQETERFEEAELSMDNKEAGYTMDAFSMDAERKEGNFDDDLNFVWKRKGEDPDDVPDAWLGEIDAASEDPAKVAKRRKLMEQQQAAQAEPDEPAADVRALLTTIVGILHEGESVASGLRRLSGAKSGGPSSQRQTQCSRDRASGKRPREEAAPAAEDDLEGVLRRQQFAQLTEAADALLRTGRFDIYSERREALLEAAGGLPGGGGGRGGDANGTSTHGHGVDQAAAALGIDSTVHAGAVSAGFVLDSANGVYHNATSDLFFDPRTTLYWNPAAPGTYYYYDSVNGQFVPADMPAAASPPEHAAGS